MDAVRPARCPACGAPGAPKDGPKGLHGHGVRSRMQLGPAEPGAQPEVSEITARRFLCSRCGVVVVSLPRGVLPRLRYRAVAVALALSLWALEGHAAHAVRAQVSPLRITGLDARRGWHSLRRWARAACRLWPPIRPGPGGARPRELALRAMLQLAALAPIATGVLVADACAGALHR